MDHAELKDTLIDLLEDTFAEEIGHLRLRCIREEQAPRFSKLKESHPEILSGFLRARCVHDRLLDARRKRIVTLTRLIEAKLGGQMRGDRPTNKDAETELAIEKERRIYWQDLTFAAMNTVDQIIGGKTCEDTFKDDLDRVRQRRAKP